MKASRFWPSLSTLHYEWTCQFLLVIVLGGVVQRYLWRDIEDPYKCNALLNEGSWLDGASNFASQATYRNWQPAGCMMHRYDKQDIQKCLDGRRLVIAGDSTSRQIFEALIEKMGHKLLELGDKKHFNDIKHQDLELRSGTTTISFIWAPYLNSSSLDRELKKFRYEPSLTDSSQRDTALLYLGAPGLWHAHYDGDKYLEDFSHNVDQIFPYANLKYMQQLGHRQEPSNLLLMVPIPPPYHKALSSDRKLTMTPERIGSMNDYIQQTSDQGKLPVIWSFNSMLDAANSEGTHDSHGFHLTTNVAEVRVDVLLNLRCNAQLSDQSYPRDRTCCMKHKTPGTVQWLFIFFSIGVLLFIGGNTIRYFLTSAPASDIVEKFKPISTILFVLCFCFLADRTHLFEKAQKQFSALEFGALCFAATLAGLLSVGPVKKSSKLSAPKDDLFLSREQTDEWKGWMQALILLYHYTGGSKVLGIYKVIRLLVSAYLFMTGYGHTLSFLQSENFSLKRAAGIVLRLNILTVALSYVMDTDYLFYYFPALSTFWYMVIYLVFRIAPKYNHNTIFVLCKIIVSGLMTTAFVRLPDVMESVAWFLELVFKVVWDIPEWRFRMSLDLYIVYIGMIAALYRHQSQRRQQNQSLTVEVEPSRSCLSFSSQPGSGIIGMLCSIASIVLMAAFVLLTWGCENKVAYNRLHPYISWAPIFIFVMLRNCHEVIRGYHSQGFAWLGRISLETYVLQYHIWLAVDTKGLLRMGIFNRAVEAAILTPLFVWFSWRASEATRGLVRQVVEVKKPEPKQNVDEEAGHALLPLNGNPEEEADEKVTAPSKSSRRCCRWKGISHYFEQVVTDLRWRLFAIMVTLWVANLICDRPSITEVP